MTLWVDLTSALQEQGRHPHGTTRTERGIVGAFAMRDDLELGFTAYHRGTGRYIEFTRDEVRAILGAAIRQHRDRERAGVWRRRLWGLQSRLIPTRPPRAPGHPITFATGDTLLLAGEHTRHDFARLLAIKRAHAMRLAFVFFDLLQVLPPDDPRLRDPDSADLPQSDFLSREAALVLPISRFSARALEAHLRQRAWPAPPITPIRLAGALPSTGPGRAVPPFVPGRFALCVGDVVARKNHALLLRVWRRLADPPQLAIVGRIDLEANAVVDAVRTDKALARQVTFLPNLDDAGLHWLYRNCRFTVFPSLLEGFGLPVAESLAYGKPCLASNAAAIPEAGQGAAISLDPGDDDSWRRAVERLEDDAALAEETARIAASFRPISWQDTASDIIAALGAPFLYDREAGLGD